MYRYSRTPVFKFLRATISGGVLVMLPIVLVIIIVGRAIQILRKLSAPLSHRMPELILGFDGSVLLAILLLILICFITGLMVRAQSVQSRIGKLEDFLSMYVPGYSMVKSIAADTLGQVMEGKLQPVLIEDDDAYNLGFLVEEKDGWSTVFLPEAPRHDSGEVKIIPSVKVKKIDMPANLANRSIKNYGKGVAEWIPKTGL